MRGERRARSDCQRLAFQANRGRRFSWFSALLDGRITGSGAIFGGSASGAPGQVAAAAAQAGAQTLQGLANQATAKANTLSTQSQAQNLLTSPLGLVLIALVVYLALRKKQT